jgi:mannose-6-phosphate isomerase-like protein (cupin superfamily)
MRVIKPADFTGKEAWAALDIEKIPNATVRLHWTDKPYIWHVNDGPEVFVVLDGMVRMQARKEGEETSYDLLAGDVFHAEAGDEHKATPIGTARVLVVETEGSL